jgi:hypothetical protein
LPYVYLPLHAIDDRDLRSVFLASIDGKRVLDIVLDEYRRSKVNKAVISVTSYDKDLINYVSSLSKRILITHNLYVESGLRGIILNLCRLIPRDGRVFLNFGAFLPSRIITRILASEGESIVLRIKGEGSSRNNTVKDLGDGHMRTCDVAMTTIPVLRNILRKSGHIYSIGIRDLFDRLTYSSSTIDIADDDYIPLYEEAHIEKLIDILRL